QIQDSQFSTGVLHILAGHSGPETAADARTHFGIFAPQVWKLFPRDQTIHLSFWDYNDVAPGYFAAAEIAAREKKVGIITLEVARPDFKVADRSTFADKDVRAAAKGLYVIRDFTPGKPKHGYVVAQGSSPAGPLGRRSEGRDGSRAPRAVHADPDRRRHPQEPRLFVRPRRGHGGGRAGDGAAVAIPRGEGSGWVRADDLRGVVERAPV